MARFVDKVNALDVDLVLIGGDVLEGDRDDEVLAPFEAEFRRLKTRYGVYGSYGNHDRFGGVADRVLRKVGIRMLADEVIKIDGACLSRRAQGRRTERREPETHRRSPRRDSGRPAPHRRGPSADRSRSRQPDPGGRPTLRPYPPRAAVPGQFHLRPAIRAELGTFEKRRDRISSSRAGSSSGDRASGRSAIRKSWWWTSFCGAASEPRGAGRRNRPTAPDLQPLALNPAVTWVPSQNGLMPDFPQRQSVTRFRIS